MTVTPKRRPPNAKTPQDRRPKKPAPLPDDGHAYFTHEGATYKSSSSIADVITFDLMEKILDYGESPMVAVAALRALYGDDKKVMGILKPLRFDSPEFADITEQVFERLGDGFGATVGESSGSSPSSETTGEPSNTNASDAEPGSDG